MTTWTQPEAVSLCVDVESVCPAFGCHVALTGGLLYKRGPRKDCDLVFYRVRQVECIDFAGLLDALEIVGIDIPVKSRPRWIVKAACRGKPVDIFFPELDGQYQEQPEDSTPHAEDNGLSEFVFDG